MTITKSFLQTIMLSPLTIPEHLLGTCKSKERAWLGGGKDGEAILLGSQEQN